MDRLSSKKTQAILLKVNVHTHTMLKAYSQSINQSMNTVIDTLLQEFVKSIEPTLRVAFQIPTAVIPSVPSRESAKERLNRFTAWRQATSQGQDLSPEEFGLTLKSGEDPSNMRSYELKSEEESSSQPVPSPSPSPSPAPAEEYDPI